MAVEAAVVAVVVVATVTNQNRIEFIRGTSGLVPLCV